MTTACMEVWNYVSWYYGLHQCWIIYNATFICNMHQQSTV